MPAGRLSCHSGRMEERTPAAPLRVLLIRAAPVGLAFRPVGPPAVAAPLGLLSVAAALRRDGPPGATITVRNLATDVRSLDELPALIRGDAPDLVGISALTLDEPRLFATARAARAACPAAAIVAGGPHATLDPGRCLAEPALDGVVVGEGEQTFAELARALAAGRDPAGIAGLHWRTAGGEVRRGRRRPFLAELDELPPLAWDLVDLATYSRLFNFHDLPPRAPPYAPLLSSRGCPWRCTYCHNLFGRRARLHSAARVVDDVARLVRDHGVGEVHFVDDVFNVHRPRMRAICEGLAARGLRVALAFPNGLRGDILDGEDLAGLQRAGCYSVTFAVETASPRLQALIRKNLDVDRVLANARTAVELGLITSGYLMLGFPTETREEMEATVAAVERSALDLPRVFTLCPYPGTAIFELAVEHGFEPAGRGGGDYDYDQAATNASPLSDEELAEVLAEAQRRLYSYAPRLRRLERLLRTHPDPDSPFFALPFWENVRRRLGETAGPVAASAGARPTGRSPRPTGRAADVVLLFPPLAPGFEIPELGLPQLTASLRAAGARVEQRDLDAELVHRAWATPDAMEAVLRRPGWRRLLAGRPTAGRSADGAAARGMARAYREQPAARHVLLEELIEAWRLAPPSPVLDDVLAWVEAGHDRLDRGLADGVSDLLAAGPPRLAGLSLCTPRQLGPALRTARLLREAGCATVLLGGPWARAAAGALPGWPALLDHVDGIATGEAEATLTAALAAVADGRDLAGTPGLVVRRGGVVRGAPPAPSVPLAELPLADYAGLPLALYPRQRLPLRTRRGCPWGRCLFCHHVQTGAGAAAPGDPPLPAAQAVDQLEALVRAHGLAEFELANLSTPVPELLALADGIAARGLPVRWRALARIERGLDRAALRRLERGGCRGLELGLESVAGADLRRVRKGIDAADLDGILEAASGTEVAISLFVMGLPGQRREDLDATLAYGVARRERIAGWTLQPFRLGRATAAWDDPASLGLEIEPAAATSVDVFDLPHRGGDGVPYEDFVRRAMAAAMAFARRPGGREPTLWDVRSRMLGIRGPGPPGSSATGAPPRRALLVRLDALGARGAGDELGLLAGTLPALVVLRAGAEQLGAAQRLARLARILEPGCTVALVGPAVQALAAAPRTAAAFDLSWSGEDEEER